MDESINSLSEVSGTMLITLYSRARETQSLNPIIQDPKAVEIINLFKKELAGSSNPIHQKIVNDTYNPKLAVTMALRSRCFDRYVLDFLERHPDGTVINFGCGLDTRFDRIDNGNVKWFDIDFASVIALRRRFMAENERRHFIACSILDEAWTEQVKTGGPYLILAEGVFMYLTETDVKKLLSMVKVKLGPFELVCEVSNLYWVNKMNTPYMQRKFKRQLGMESGALFSFGIPDSHYFESWAPDYKLLDDWTYFDDREKKLGWFNLFSKIDVIRRVQWTIHYQIG
ncbi:class I SAM-dependent methyltransferase [bacterium]|nr:class I SAM-dependent methyltransferase [bacterium]